MASEVTQHHITWFLPPNSLLIEPLADQIPLECLWSEATFLQLCIMDQFMIITFQNCSRNIHLTSGIQISFKPEKFKHFLGGNNNSCLVDCLPDSWFIWHGKANFGLSWKPGFHYIIYIQLTFWLEKMKWLLGLQLVWYLIYLARKSRVRHLFHLSFGNKLNTQTAQTK